MADKPKVEKHVEERLEHEGGRPVVKQKITEIIERTVAPGDAELLTPEERQRIDRETARRLRSDLAKRKKRLE